MHFCGNLAHDVPYFLAVAFPTLVVLYKVVVARLHVQRCDCGHDHSHGETHD